MGSLSGIVMPHGNTVKGTRDRALERWKFLRDRYEQRGVVLALGAGVSTGCKLPSWPELLRRMGDECLGANGAATVDQLIQTGMTLPAVAGILESKRPKDVSFLELLSDKLYRDFPFRTPITTARERKDLLKFVHDSNATMRSVAALCARTDGAGFAPNGQIRAVVNFNVDCVLRAYARARYENYLFGTIESASKLGRLGRIPIYHMHGFLRFYPNTRAEDEEEARCVFTEGEYYDFFNRPNSVFNYTFLYLLREFNCLFIGMSMTDENIRRLLHYSTSERRQGAGGSAGTASERVALRHFAILKRSGSKKVDELTDISLRRIGTRVLWIDAFEEIPARLGYVYGDADWGGVY